MMRVGLFGGSFNPVHIGHLIIGSHIASSDEVDEVWFVLSPTNPLKVNAEFENISEHHRLNMLKIALESIDNPKIKLCDIELSMPRPSYTINTLTELKRQHPDILFKWIIGSDNLHKFDNWKATDEILDNFGLLVYPRPGEIAPLIQSGKIKQINAPMLDISSTMIRDGIKARKDMSCCLPYGVSKYIKLHNLYD
ncbi:MAG: nicotinate-nucleotide adenylyltransferase [Paramuribaculum sp.]|nr:nicotinate-nucleotide adenylyltransferase [Paramuribaculum sp.]